MGYILIRGTLKEDAMNLKDYNKVENTNIEFKEKD